MKKQKKSYKEQRIKIGTLVFVKTHSTFTENQIHPSQPSVPNPYSNMTANKSTTKIITTTSNNSVPINTVIATGTTWTATPSKSSSYSVTSINSFMLAVTYVAKGYKTIEDYFKEKHQVITHESLMDKDDYDRELCADGFRFGKPFSGIVVDMFVPNDKTKLGKEIMFSSINLTTLYKVLIGKEGCFWFAAKDVYKLKARETK